MLSLRLALRNLRAHRHRNSVLLGAISFATCLALLFMAFSDGQLDNYRLGFQAILEAPQQLMVINHIDDHNFRAYEAHAIEQSDRVIAAIQTVPEVLSVQEKFFNFGGANIHYKQQRFQGFSIHGLHGPFDAQIDPQILILEGNRPVTSTQAEVMLHQKAARALGLGSGDRIILSGNNPLGQVYQQELTVSGIYLPKVDHPALVRVLFINSAAYHYLLGSSPEAPSVLHVSCKPENLQVVYEQIWELTVQQSLGIAVLNWGDGNNGYQNSYQSVRLILLIMAVLIMVVVFAGLSTSVSANLYDRQSEIATYYCLGSEGPFLWRLYFLEIFLLTLLACGLGLLLALLVQGGVNLLNIKSDNSSLQVIFAGSQFRLALAWPSVLLVVGVEVLACLASAALVLVRQLRVPPLRAMGQRE
jgi:ABC-type lipoprotein release transport system permease subunit